MPRWIINRPESHCHDGEIEVARSLNSLSDRWIIRWGFYYQDNDGQTREGDFLILGPHGGLLVLEVKTGRTRHFASTGNWELDVAGQTDHPLFQLDAEWKATINQFQTGATPGSPIPTIERALCLPRVQIPTTSPQWQGIPRRHLIASNDLKTFQLAWKKTFAHPDREVTERQRRTFLDLFAANSKPERVREFINHTEHHFRQQLTTQYTLLDSVEQNQQLLIEGGAGTGKTWLAIEQAVRYADKGNDVLFLSYNLPLSNHLQALIGRRDLAEGSITPLSWEALATRILEACGLENEAPPYSATHEEKRDYYQNTLPSLLLDCIADPALSDQIPRFDSLVVDEAQDHDTHWWDLYFALLPRGTSSPVTLAYDLAQRPPFRSSGAFDPVAVAGFLSQPAFLRLPRPLRYTRQIHEYLLSLQAEGTSTLVAGITLPASLPEGPDVIEQFCSKAKTKAAIEVILTQWQKQGLCPPQDVLILHLHRDLSKTPLGETKTLLGKPLVEATETDVPKSAIRHTNIHRAKGLDATAVIVIGLHPFESVTDPAYHHTHFMAASRARQLLAIISLEA
jgi:hypothetical protein